MNKETQIELALDKLRQYIQSIEEKNQKKIAFIYSILAQFFFTLMYLCVGKIRTDYSSHQILNTRMITGFILNSLMCSTNKIPIYIDKPNIFKLVALRGLLGGVSMASLFSCLSMMNISDGIVLINTSPIWTNFLAYFFLNESLSKKSLILCFISFAGIILISRPTSIFGEDILNNNNLKYHNQFLGSILGLIGGLSIAAATILIRKLSLEFKCSTATLLQYYYLIGTITSTILLIIYSNNINSIEYQPINFRYIYISLLLSLSGFSGQLLQSRALVLQKASIISTLLYLQVVLTFLQDIFILNVHVYLTSVIGAVLIIICSISIVL